jgi:hypothetical protein
MSAVVAHIRDTIRDGRGTGKAKIDIVVGTHEHKDHLSGFNQARDVFDKDFEFGAVWLGWPENLTQPEVKKIKDTKRKAARTLRAALDSPLAAADTAALDGVASLLAFGEDDDRSGSKTIAEALEYLKRRGKAAGDLRYLEPGTGPIALKDLDSVRVYVLGPPRDPMLLKSSSVTAGQRNNDAIYHLARTADAGLDSLTAAVSAGTGFDADRYHPFATEHRIPRQAPSAHNGRLKANPRFSAIQAFVAGTYDDAKQAWRRIDRDWLNAFDQLALDLDSDTNNTSLVLAFEFVASSEVLLFVGDAQVGNWQSWTSVTYRVPGRDTAIRAHDLLARTIFYKVGHHCSQNATLKKNGLELMQAEDLVAFIPLDKATARKQGKKDEHGVPRGWDMPAVPLFKALNEHTKKRVVLSDGTEKLTAEAVNAGIRATDMFIDYFLL